MNLSPLDNTIQQRKQSLPFICLKGQSLMQKLIHLTSYLGQRRRSPSNYLPQDSQDTNLTCRTADAWGSGSFQWHIPQYNKASLNLAITNLQNQVTGTGSHIAFWMPYETTHPAMWNGLFSRSLQNRIMAAAGAEPSHLLPHTVEYYYPHVIPTTLFIYIVVH